jgi:hypothetical protein
MFFDVLARTGGRLCRLFGFCLPGFGFSRPYAEVLTVTGFAIMPFEETSTVRVDFLGGRRRKKFSTARGRF